MSQRRLEDLLKTPWRHPKNVFKIFLQDVLKTSWRRMTKTNILVLIKPSSTRLEEVFWRRLSRGNIFVLIRRLEDECLLGIHHLNIDKIDLYAKDPHEANYQSLINKRKVVDLKDCNDSKTSIECSNDMDNIYEKIEK